MTCYGQRMRCGMVAGLLVTLLAMMSAVEVNTKTEPDADLSEFYRGVEKFTLHMFKELVKTNETNLVFSSMTTWVLLALLSEASKGKTLRELQRTVRLPNDHSLIHRGFGSIKQGLRSVIAGTDLNMGSAIFSDINRPLLPDFEEKAVAYYNTSLQCVQFQNTSQAAHTINSWVREATKDRIDSIVSEDELQNAQLVLTSAIFFRGLWKNEFNSSLTNRVAFFNENGAKLGDVDMMHQTGNFRMGYISYIKCLVLELPYSSNENVMMLFLPEIGSGNDMSTVIEKIYNLSETTSFIKNISAKLDADPQTANIEDITVSLPRFSIKSKTVLLRLLQEMGIRALFQPGEADLSGMSSLNLYVSQMLHKAEISVDEKGTTASAASSAGLHNYNLPTTFVANRPFLFMIVQKSTNTILFAGKVGDPNSLSSIE